MRHLCARSLSKQIVFGGLFMTCTSIGLSVGRKNSLDRRCEDWDGRTCTIFPHTWTVVIWSALKHWLKNVLTRAWYLFSTFFLVGWVHQTCCLLSTLFLLATTFNFLTTAPAFKNPWIVRFGTLYRLLVCSIFIYQRINFSVVWGQCCDLVRLFILCWIILHTFPWPLLCGMGRIFFGASIYL
jgi:hypothetical protein